MNKQPVDLEDATENKALLGDDPEDEPEIITQRTPLVPAVVPAPVPVAVREFKPEVIKVDVDGNTKKVEMKDSLKTAIDNAIKDSNFSVSGSGARNNPNVIFLTASGKNQCVTQQCSSYITYITIISSIGRSATLHIAHTRITRFL